MDEPVMQPYAPTWRDRIAGALMGTDYSAPSPERRHFVEGLLGSSGLGNTGLSVSDLTPVGSALGFQEDAQRGNKFGMALNAMAMLPGGRMVNFHGSPIAGLERVSAQPITRQFDNATSQLGAFAAPTVQGAERYAGKTGQVYQTEARLNNPYDMPPSEWLRLQSPNKGPNGEILPGDQWGARAEQLKQEAAALKAQLQDAGHDGVILRGPKGEAKEIAYFNDFPVLPHNGIDF